MNLPTQLQHRILARLFVLLAALCLWPQPSHAEHLCDSPRSNEVVVAEVVGPGAGYYLCEWSSESESARPVTYYSPEEWKAFFDHMGEVEAVNQKQRILMGKRYRQLQEGMWFFPGEEPFAGWSTGSETEAKAPENEQTLGRGCTASFWTLDGEVIMSTLHGGEGMATISYVGHTIPAPGKSSLRQISLIQDGETQTVSALISPVGRGKRKMGMVSFAVPSGNILLSAIEDKQSYILSDKGKQIFAGQWHDGLKARDALASCLAKRR